MTNPLKTNRLWMTILLAGCLSATGCGPLIGVTLDVFRKPRKVQAVYQPPEGKKILVFVDDLQNPVSYEPIKAELTERLNEQLIENNVAERVVPYERLLTLMAATPEFHALSIGQIGNKLGADIVLYVHVDTFSLKDNEVTPLWHGQLATTIRMVDVTRGRLWPEDRPAGFTVKPVETPTEYSPSQTYEIDLATSLARQMATRVARLFYDHEIKPEDESWAEGDS